jgi:hypothetical protein
MTQSTLAPETSGSDGQKCHTNTDQVALSVQIFEFVGAKKENGDDSSIAQ